MVKSKLSSRKRAWLRAGEFAALGAGAVILLVFLASTLDGTLIRNGQGAAVVTAVLVDLANTDRSGNHVSELIMSPALTAVAQAKANDMAEKGYFAHTSPEGKDPWYWFKQNGYLFTYAGENLAVDFSDSADVEKAWMNSPAHRANLLNGHFTEIGIATAVGTYEGHQTTFVVQEFGTPAHQPTAAPQTLTQSAKPTEIAIATTETTPAPQVTTRPAKPVVAAAISENGSTTEVTKSEPVEGQAVLGTNATGIVSPEPQGFDSLWNVFAASPKTTLRYAYYLFGLLILIAVVIETGIEVRKHHVRHVALAIALLVLMGGLFLTADQFVFTDPVLGDAGTLLPGV